MLGKTVITTNQVPPIAWKELTVGEHRGNGSYGDVYQGWWQREGERVEVAIKLLQQKTLSPKLTKEFETETAIMWKYHLFPNIVQLRGICTESGHYAMVMEYLPQNLRDRLEEEKDLPWQQRWQIALDMAQGLAFLHARYIVHRDLKSANILLDAQGRAKISDFGLAKVKIGINSSKRKETGSIRWQAPELFQYGSSHTPASDVYSLGMIFWELAARRLPFENGNEITVRGWIEKGVRETLPDDCPPALAEIIQACWATPDKRPSAEVLVSRLKAAQAEAVLANDPVFSSSVLLNKLEEIGQQLKRAEKIQRQTLEYVHETNWRTNVTYEIQTVGNREPFSAPIETPIEKSDHKSDGPSLVAGLTVSGNETTLRRPTSTGTNKIATRRKIQQTSSGDKGDSKLVITPVLTSSSPIHAGSSQQQQSHAQPAFDAKAIGQFLQYVANAEYDKVKARLAKKPELVLCRGNITDFSKRTFPDITPFQYALWALDWHMWTILLKYPKYLTPAEAALQWQELETKGTPHGKEVSWQGLIDAYEMYHKATSGWEDIWCKQVGGTQFQVPAHVANEYMHPTRRMDPTSDFTTSAHGANARDFYVKDLGTKNAWRRAQRGVGSTLFKPLPGYKPPAQEDAAAISALYATRRRQKADLAKALMAALPTGSAPVSSPACVIA